LSIDGDNVHVSYGINDKFNKISTFNIYDINYKIKYHLKHINEIVESPLNKQHKLTIVIMNSSQYLNQDNLQEYCNKHNYTLQKYDEYVKNKPYDARMILFLYEADVKKLNINYDLNLDRIINMCGDSKYICFEGLSIHLEHSSLINNFPNFQEYENTSIDDYLSVINTGYVYRKNIGTFLHKNYLEQILYSEKSIFTENITIMPNIINPINKLYNDTKIPKIIHQSFESRAIPECLSLALHTWLNLNPDYEYRYYDNGDRRKLISDHFDSKVLKAYDMLIPGAYRCDLWRFCCVYIYGGIYADIKLGALNPIKNIIDSDVDYLLVNDINDNSMLNGIFGAKPKDPLIYKVIITIVNRVLNRKYGYHNLYPTGPLAMGSVILKEFGVDKHMKTGKYKINDSMVQVYDHYDDGNNGRIILDNNNSVLINTRHNNKTKDQNYLKSITGNFNYGILWDQRKIYREI
jgi:mannosyltransferase OCH1-like enzyme